jgi:hypothetical protein
MKHNFLIRYFTPDPPLPPSLADLTPDLNNPTPAPKEEEIKSGDGKETPEDLAKKEAEQKALQEKQQQDEKKDTPPEGKMYNEKGELVDDPNFKKEEGKKDDKEEEPDDTPEAFFTEVDKYTGLPVKVEYPEDVDPLSPQGVALREQAVRLDAIDQWEAKIKKEYPRAYSYFLHHMDGGSDAEFLDSNRGIALPDRTTVETSVDVQTSLVKQDLISKGIDPEVADAQVAVYIKNNQLKDKSLGVLDARTKAREEELKLIETRQQEANKRADAAIQSMTKKIEGLLPGLGFVVADADKQKVVDFIANNMAYSRADGKFYISQEVNPEDMKASLDALVFQYYKGDLSKVVTKKAKTQASQRLRMQADKTKAGTPTHQEDRKDQDGYIPLGALGPQSK